MLFPIAAGHAYSTKWRIAGSTAGFGADRKPGRQHTGCDIGAAHGTPMVAIEGGTVFERGSKPFIENTPLWAIAIKHDSGFIARYTEISGIPDTLKKGSKVIAGQQLGIVQQWGRFMMLHFELHSDVTRTQSLSMSKKYWPAGKSAATVTDTDKQAIRDKGYIAPLQRRDDILDPREFLLALEAKSDSAALAALKGQPGLGATSVYANISRAYSGPLSVDIEARFATDYFGPSDTEMAVDL